ncbi:MAG: FkbM family methyltransferase [Okeania sp. SIO3B5]|uniref:protein arginine N-methyltransferase n=1 Tax=Okeania sp. SIO3B5 TaxID=2607811 RepID=UPI0013FF5995|nr:FkbM family methyltransferase [Okeania sp. SIO3B5]NEO52693.1 FkbM family methyltransferase [Okeania sp. SIO3B5]
MSYIKKGNEYLRQGKIDEAIEAYQISIQLNPNFHWAYYKLGDALKRKGKIQEAEEIYHKANTLQNKLENNQFNPQIKYEKLIQEIHQENISLKTEIDQLRGILSQIVNTSLSQLSAYFDISSRQGRALSNKMLVDFFLNTTKLLKPNYFFDIGSRDGSTSIAVKKGLPTVKCCAFEANINNYESFKERKEFNELSIDYKYLAISNHNGFADFHIPTELNGQKLDKNIGNSSLMISTHPSCKYQVTRVECSKLDNFCLNNRINIDKDQNLALWIDVEGAALQVLEGANKCLTQTSIILVEVEEYPHWTGAALADEITSKLISNNFIPVARDFEYSMQYNLIFIHSNYLNKCKGLVYNFFSNIGNRNYIGGRK